MTSQGLANYIRWRTGTTTVTFPDSEMLIIINAVLPEFALSIESVNEGKLGSIDDTTLIATGTGLADDGTYTREYPLPTNNVGRIDHLEAKLGTDGEVIRLDEENPSVVRNPYDEDLILSHYSNVEGSAKFLLFRDSLFLLTGEIEEDVPKGLILWGYSQIAYFTTVAENTIDITTMGIPYALQHRFADAVIIEWKTARGSPIPLSSQETLYEQLLMLSLDKIKDSNRDRHFKSNDQEDLDYGSSDGSEL